MTAAHSAADAFKLYEQALAADALIQRRWHQESDGRHLACALGVLGTEIDNPSKCPAQIMPRWLAQMVPWFFDRQKFDDAKDWGLRFYSELARIDGQVPFSVVHDWHANVVAPLAIEVATKLGKPTEPHEAVRDLHARALNGNTATKGEWVATLRPAYANAYANAYAYAYADAYAKAYAYANANAYANAYAYADAYAYANAYADAYANANAIKRLADGMVDCLARVR